jgi:hypothetical protein
MIACSLFVIFLIFHTSQNIIEILIKNKLITFGYKTFSGFLIIRIYYLSLVYFNLKLVLFADDKVLILNNKINKKRSMLSCYKNQNLFM